MRIIAHVGSGQPEAHSPPPRASARACPRGRPPRGAGAWGALLPQVPHAGAQCRVGCASEGARAQLPVQNNEEGSRGRDGAQRPLTGHAVAPELLLGRCCMFPGTPRDDPSVRTQDPQECCSTFRGTAAEPEKRWRPLQRWLAQNPALKGHAG